MQSTSSLAEQPMENRVVRFRHLVQTFVNRLFIKKEKEFKKQ